MTTLTDPAILFFMLGILAGALRSNLEIPQPIAKFLSLYLLMAMGLKGGFALAKTGFSTEMLSSVACALLLAVAIPAIAYLLLKRLLSPFDAAAVAATYGSVSAVTFITAMQLLDHQNMAYGGHMSVAMVLMESPAIVMAIMLASHARKSAGLASTATTPSAPHLFRESLTEGAQVLLLGSLAIGALTGAKGAAIMQPFSGDLFKGMLSFFLLDMGILVARHLREFKAPSGWLLVYGLGAPVVHALLAIFLAKASGLGVGDATLLAVLAASASYIVVPAVVRQAIPEANPALYIGMSLGVTFPFNILIGIPLYANLASTFIA